MTVTLWLDVMAGRGQRDSKPELNPYTAIPAVFSERVPNIFFVVRNCPLIARL